MMIKKKIRQAILCVGLTRDVTLTTEALEKSRQSEEGRDETETFQRRMEYTDRRQKGGGVRQDFCPAVEWQCNNDNNDDDNGVLP